MNKSEEKIYELLKNNELYRDEKGIYTIFPQEYLIEQSGCGGSTIRRILKSLEEQGFIHREWLAKEHLNLFYFSNEDFSGRTIIDINEKSLLKKVSTQKVEQKNCTHSPENEHHSPENEHHSPENEHHSPENEHQMSTTLPKMSTTLPKIAPTPLKIITLYRIIQL